MYHLLVHINQDIKGDKTKIRTQQYIQLNTEAKEIQQLNHGGLDSRRSIRPQPSFIKIISHYKKIGYNNNVCTLLSFLTACRLVGPQTL